MTHYNSWNKRKLPNLIITWTLIFLICRVWHIFLAQSKYSPLTSSTGVIYKIADSDIASKSTYTDSHLIDSLMTQSWKLWVPTFFFPNFVVNKVRPWSKRLAHGLTWALPRGVLREECSLKFGLRGLLLPQWFYAWMNLRQLCQVIVQTSC